MGWTVAVSKKKALEKNTPEADGALLRGTVEEIAEMASGSEETLLLVVGSLSCDRRTQRTLAARVVRLLTESRPDLLRGHGPELADALLRPEAQTRWEVLAALEKMVAQDARVADRAIGATITSLHDAESGITRLAAFQLLCSYGATTAHRSEKVWPFIDEAVRVYHGDPEFPSMLLGVYRLVTGAASDEVKLAAAKRMEFDAETAKGIVGHRARMIVGCAPTGKKKLKR